MVLDKHGKLKRKERAWFLPDAQLMQFECEVILESCPRVRRTVHKITRERLRLELVFKDGKFTHYDEDQRLVRINFFDDEGVHMRTIEDNNTVFRPYDH